MKRTCYPLKRKIHSYEYLLSAGIPAGPAVIWHSIFSGWNIRAKAAGFFAGLFLVSSGYLVLRSIIQCMLRLSWDESGFTWYLRKRSWQDFSTVTVQNEVTVSSVSEAALEFKRYLVFTGHGARECRVPFSAKDFLGRDLVNSEDPAWREFLTFIEQRYSLLPGSLVAEQKQREEIRSESMEGTTPARVTWFFGAAGFILIIVMLVSDMDSLTATCVFGGYLCAIMLIVLIGRRYGWDSVMDFFRLKRK